MENITFVDIVEFPTNDNNLEKNLKSSGFWILESISIDGAATGPNAHNWSWTVSQPWCNGSGTLNYPYIIENITINGEGSEACLNIKNSDKYFTVRNCTFYNAYTGIKLENVQYGTILNNTLYENRNDGISLIDSLHCFIQNNSLIKNGHSFRGSFIPEYFTLGGGVELWNSHENIIRDNNFDSNKGYGVALGNTVTIMGEGTDRWGRQCYNNSISRNKFNNSTRAVWTLPNSIGNNLSDNKIISSFIYLEGSIGTTLLRNEFINSFIWLQGPVGAESSYNIDTSNTIDDKYLYYYSNESSLNKNNFPDAGQIILVNCRNSIIENALIGDCQYFSLDYCSDICLKNSDIVGSISLDYTDSCQIIGNNFTDSLSIIAYYSNNNSISHNFANESFSHIWISYSNNNKISDNILIIDQPPLYGEVPLPYYGAIRLWESSYNELSRNSIQFKNESFESYNKNGIELALSNYNTIIENNLTNFDIGIYLDFSYNSTISNNYINDTDIGIYLRGSDFNSITNNVLIVRNACFYISSDSDGNIFENNYCNIPEEQIIPGYLPSLILLCIVLIAIVFHIHKNEIKKEGSNAK